MLTVILHALSVLIASVSFFFFNDTATTEIYTLSLHDALPISGSFEKLFNQLPRNSTCRRIMPARYWAQDRSEEHTSELQSPCNLVCRLLLEKKKKTKNPPLSEFSLPRTASRLLCRTSTRSLHV